jgi:3-deoxy-D-manno-octulosonate 8-phosphate phosphatase (KDO 8-P phosphatase)
MSASPNALPVQSALHFDPALLLQAQGIKIVFFDVDGILTDGGLYFTESGESIKRFHTLDGHGLKLLMRAGITPAIITGRDSKPLRKRLEALGLQHVRYGTEDKAPAAQEMLQGLGLDWSQAAAMGDDWPDLPVLTRCAFACSVPGAQADVLTRAHYVTRASGGNGAVREVCDLLLAASGQYATLLADAIAGHGIHKGPSA